MHAVFKRLNEKAVFRSNFPGEIKNKRNFFNKGGIALLGIIACTGPVTAEVLENDKSGIAEEILIVGEELNLPSATASRLGLTVMETPASVEIINGDRIRERLDTSVLEAVTRSAGFSNEANPGNGGQSIAARGFRGQGAVTKLFDGTNYYTAASTLTFPFDTWGVERIEILKGPSSVLYGEGGIGGAINVIPKRPEQEHGGNFRLTMGEDVTTFVGLDLTGGLTDTLAYRLNYSNSQSDNWVKNGESDADMFSLALRWELSDDLVLSARYDYGDQEPLQYFGIPVVDGEFASGLGESNFNVGDARISYEDKAFRLKADWTISETVSMETEVYRLETERFWKNSEFYSLDSTTGLVDRFDPLVIGHDMEHDGLRTNFVFSNRLGGRELRSSLGFEINDISFERPSNFGPANPNPIDWGNDFDTVDPDNFSPGTLSDLTDAEVLPDNESDVDQYALFTESQLQATDRLAIVVGLRYEDVETDYNRFGNDPIHQSLDELTGRFGLVYDVNADTVLYAQYGTGATHPSDSIVTASASNRESDFIKSEQVEVGIKQELMDGRLQWTLALFDIVKNDLVEDDPDSGNPGDKIVIPEQTSQGGELGFSFQVNENLQIYGNGSLLEAETQAGIAPIYVPEKTANVGLNWRVLDKLQFIADARYVGERFHPSIPIPSYTVVDASARININNKYSVTVRVDNLTDERYASAAYYSSTWLIGKPRTFSVTADYSF
jgi:iron complex outermembrane receptor protein